MKEIIVTGLDDSAVERLEKRAAAHGRSLEEEVRHILTRGVDALEYAQTVLARIQAVAAKQAETTGSMKQSVSEFRKRMQQPILHDIDDL